ncbi:MAG: hypothetical protein NT144_01275 [Bacteroidia bacterium]|nr:hypothetical protein [Bacteroidia bacterium]
MLKNIDLSKPKTQYFLGLALNIIFLIILYSFATSYKNLQIPAGIYQKNIWGYSDVMTYVGPALNFVDHNVFGISNTPDHLRTIGYPAIISFFYYTFGKNWLLLLQIFQSIIFAFIYPAVTATIKILLPDFNNKLIKIVFIVLCISGAYFTRSAVVLTDTLFILLFVVGFYLGLKTYITKRYDYLLLYLILIAASALIRPTLSLFPLLNLSIGYWVAKKYCYSVKKTLVKSLFVSIAILCLINISTVRNYLNYSFFSPGSVIGLNAFEYLSKKVLIMEGNTDKYNSYREQLDMVQNISVKTKMRKAIMYQTIKQYPISTIKVLGINTINLFLSNNLLSNISNYFGYEWKAFKNSGYPFKISKLLSCFTYIFMFLYAILWWLFLLKLFNLWKNKDYETLLILFILFVMFLIPAILTGDGGSRFRLPFEHILFIFGFSTIFNRTAHNSSLPGAGLTWANGN